MKRTIIAEITCKNPKLAKQLEREIIDLISKDELSGKLVDSAIIDIIPDKMALNVKW